ncbi:phosphate/phosphite/phosphonate ABC transporter substrate-binding protein [Cryobacterium sp. Hh38]|uniref:phosphate/phosphite/phosphonate ABC transporter substrate-binding protein n=1 Tax=Cryobacterium sp. Hh38 TaxID=1259156 RepID=UPI00106D8F2C|nr:phosphate/phosphite/phosphonate ABC transporter substrate-binding protein [Cryobacterium sp. Hh38]TFD56476.1 phosphate/phosphite/phosphonate ABC transporter substrate-binding protein [Cryobacterium sp. Hh38]
MPSRTRLVSALVIGAVGLTTLLSGCSPAASDNNANPVMLRLGVPPGEADPEFLDKMQPMADLVEEATGLPVEVTQTSDYLAIVEAMRSKLLDVAIFSPMPAVIAEDVANVKPLVAALGAPYTTLIICNPEAGVTDLANIQDLSMAFVDAGSTSGNYIPRLMMQRAGVDLDALDSTFAGGHDVAALSVKQGSTDCAAVASLVLPTMVEAGAISEDDFEIVAESEPLPISTVIIARDGLSAEISAAITDAFVGNTDADILAVTSAKEYVAAEDADWSMFNDAAAELGIDIDDVKG